MRRMILAAPAMLAAALIVGCGGGGGSAVAPSTSSATTSPPATSTSSGARAAAAAAFLAFATPANARIASINEQLQTASTSGDLAGAATGMRSLQGLETSARAALARLTVPADSQSALDGLMQATGRAATTSDAMATAFESRIAPSAQVQSDFRQAESVR